MPAPDPPRRPLDLYLLPAIVGGGLGDVRELLDAGDLLDRAGFPTRIFRRPGHPWPPRIVDLLTGRRVERTLFPRPRAAHAMTFAPMWGVSAGPATAGPLGRPGPWSAEVEAIERHYGPASVVHLSLEEFARTLTSREETLERFREGGRPARAARRFLATPAGRAEVASFRQAYRRYRAFDRENLLHLYPTFRPSRRFQRECPEAIQTGPLWPARAWPRGRRGERAAARWVWYASPSTSVRLAAAVDRGLRRARPPVRITVRTPHPRAGWPSGGAWTIGGFRPSAAWTREFAGADLRIVTGSRTLLEALELGGPFLYFNGVSGRGRTARRHRPEKIRALGTLLGRAGAFGIPWRDLDAFSRAHRVEAVVRRAAQRRPPGPPVRRFDRRERPFGLESAGDVLLRAVRAWARFAGPADRFVAEFRSEARARGFAGEVGPAAGGRDIRPSAVAR